uniref:HSF_DOMAIN domain-containing protein n=1 Tax=Dracunculus medinensis TaxID=318479 RepID=A0A0N4UF00_DRAME
LQFYYSLLTSFLSFFMTKTSINGVLNRGRMFIFSSQNFRNFLQIPHNWIAADKFMMAWRLQQKGFLVLPVDDWKTRGPFNLVSALNLLDRHYDPLQLLSDLHEITSKSDALLLLAVVLPVRQYVEFHPKKKTTLPDTKLPIYGLTFEEQAVSLVYFLNRMGFELVRWGKLPYLCEGDFNRAYYVLNDGIFLLRPIAKELTSKNKTETTRSFHISHDFNSL